MPDPAPPIETAARWETIAAEARTLHGSPKSTIERQGLDDGGALHPGALAGSDATRLVLGEVLGEGGMGVVRLATQQSMGRSVAVKSLHGARLQPEPTRKLLQEAWVTGRLEHPNIVPIYDIAVEADGNPLIVLKRIEGVSWASRLGAADEAEPADGRDPLDRNLGVLIQICRALHFAHSRGIVHLDVKPDNVMLGPHGEVYMVDWGVAVALHDDGTGQLPLARDHQGIVGTPHYMAPEMLEGDGARLDARTDVYLLGATLFELLAGHPPHRGETIMEVLHAALMEEPSLPAEASTELSAVCRRAMARDPERRYPSAEALRQALQAFLRHRESERIANRARECLTQLERTLGDPEASERSARALFAQARFGFEQALASWSGNDHAREGLDRAFERMVGFELEHGDPQVSAALAREAPRLPRSLRERVDRAVARREASLDELATRRRDQDLRVGQRTRVFVFGVLGLLWTLLPVLEHIVAPARSDRDAYLIYGAVPLGSLLLLTVLSLWARESLTRTLINRSIVAALFLTLAGQLSIMIGGALLGLPPEIPMVLLPLVWAMVAGMVAMTLERRAFPIPIAFGLAFFVAAAWPQARFLALAFCCGVFAVVVVVIWWPQQLRGPIALPDDYRS